MFKQQIITYFEIFRDAVCVYNVGGFMQKKYYELRIHL